MSVAQTVFQAVLSFGVALIIHYVTGAPLWLLLLSSLVAFSMTVLVTDWQRRRAEKNLHPKIERMIAAITGRLDPGDPGETTHYYVVSNGNVFGVHDPKKIEWSNEPDSDGMDFETALGMVAQGWAVARAADVTRVVFRPNPMRVEQFVAPLHEGSMDEDTGECTSAGLFTPRPDDDLATDWLLLCSEPKLLDD